MSLASSFATTKKYHGLWVARSEIMERMKANLVPQEYYRRDTSGSSRPRVLWQRWVTAKEKGKLLGRLLAKPDAHMLATFIRHDIPNLPMAAATRVGLMGKIAALRDEYDEPMFFTCACCEELAPSDDVHVGNHGEQFCHVCVETERVYDSEVMGVYLRGADAARCFTSAEDFDQDIRDWCTASWARDHQYQRRNGVWYAPGSYNLSSELNERIYDYHDGPELGHIPSEYDNRKPRVLLGMELEVENIYSEDDEETSNESIARSILKKLNGIQPAFVKAEHDGSLDNGFELVTGYTGLDVHAKVWSQLKDAKYFDQIHSHTSDTCGLHVHVDKAGMTPLHCAKLAAFVNNAANEKLMQCVSRRYNASYARFSQHENFIRKMSQFAGPYIRQTKRMKEKVNTTYLLGNNFHGDRYSAVNFNNDHTVEFRMFRGTLKFESIMACLEFAFETWHFTQQAPLSGLTTEAFLEFICRAENRKDSKHLRAYLKAKRFRAFHTAEVKAVPKAGREAAPTEREERNQICAEPEVIMLGYQADALAHQCVVAARQLQRDNALVY